MFGKVVFFIGMSLVLCGTADAQTNQRTRFNETLQLFNEMILQHQLGDAIDFLRQDVVVNDAEKEALDAKLMEAFPDDFVGFGTVRSETLKDGFRQELLSFWTEDGSYLFVYLVLHTRKNRRHLVQFNYGTDFNKFISYF